jgi:hypothetical protein
MILGPKHVPGTPDPPRPIGNDGLAIFATDRAGWDAAKYQLQYGKVPRTGGFYHDLSIQDAIKEWAPPNVANDPTNQNDPKAYAAKIRQLTGLDPTRLIKNLSPAELNAVVLALQTIEIWEPGSCEPAPCREFLM